MALLIKANGEVIEVKPAKGPFTVEEMRNFVGGYIEMKYPAQLLQGPLVLNGIRYDITPKTHMVVNDEGLCMNLPWNEMATILYRYGFMDAVVGDVLLCEYGTEID